MHLQQSFTCYKSPCIDIQASWIRISANQMTAVATMCTTLYSLSSSSRPVIPPRPSRLRYWHSSGPYRHRCAPHSPTSNDSVHHPNPPGTIKKEPSILRVRQVLTIPARSKFAKTAPQLPSRMCAACHGCLFVQSLPGLGWVSTVSWKCVEC